MEEKGFIGYEYTTVVTKREMESFYMDYYPSFGWIYDSRLPSVKGFGWIQLKFKRNRRIENKTEIKKLQRQFEKTLKQIESLELKKYVKASIVAYTIGIVGTGFMAGSVFSIVAENVVLCAILGVIAFIGWGLPYFLYKNIFNDAKEKIDPEIDEKYDEINETCKKASTLIS